jgi:hypothetical protein
LHVARMVAVVVEGLVRTGRRCSTRGTCAADIEDAVR